MIVSKLELNGSPFEQLSVASIVYRWDPTSTGTGDITSSESVASPIATVTQFDPGFDENSVDGTDVTATVVVSGYPKVGTGNYANQVEVALAGLSANKVYRVVLSFTASADHIPARFFVVNCKL